MTPINGNTRGSWHKTLQFSFPHENIVIKARKSLVTLITWLPWNEKELSSPLTFLFCQQWWLCLGWLFGSHCSILPYYLPIKGIALSSSIMFSLAYPTCHGWFRFGEWKDTNRPEKIPLGLDTHEGFGNGLCNCSQVLCSRKKDVLKWIPELKWSLAVPTTLLNWVVQVEVCRQKIMPSSIPLNSGPRWLPVFEC